MRGQMVEQGGQVVPLGLMGALQCWPSQVHWLQLCFAGGQGMVYGLVFTP